MIQQNNEFHTREDKPTIPEKEYLINNFSFPRALQSFRKQPINNDYNKDLVSPVNINIEDFYYGVSDIKGMKGCKISAKEYLKIKSMLRKSKKVVNKPKKVIESMHKNTVSIQCDASINIIGELFEGMKDQKLSLMKLINENNVMIQDLIDDNME